MTVILALAACGPRQQPAPAAEQRAPVDARVERHEIQPYAWFRDRRPTGVAVTRDGRAFVSFPDWEDPHDLSVARVFQGGKLAAYPDAEWNTWNGDPATVQSHFVCVQSVVADGHGGLWVLDAGAPKMGRVIPGAAKLVHVDLASDRVDTTYFLDHVALPKSYLNDVRVDLHRNVAYMTDSGTGALVVLDLTTRRARRVLANHPSTAPEDDVVLRVDGRELLDERTGGPVRIGADGLALSRDGRWLYWHALTGVSLYRMDTRILSDQDRSAADLRDAVELVARTVPTDGMEIDERGRILHTAFEGDAILAYDPDRGSLETVAHDGVLAWPDSIAITPDERLFVTTSRLDEMARFSGGVDRRTEPFGLVVIPPPAEVSLR
jgi:sugar lactone lactonase YvrE